MRQPLVGIKKLMIWGEQREGLQKLAQLEEAIAIATLATCTLPSPLLETSQREAVTG